MAAEIGGMSQLSSEQNQEVQLGVVDDTQRCGPPVGEEEPGPHYVKLRGIPYETTPGEVLNFLDNCRIKGGEDGVHILLAADNRPKGEALVELEANQDLVNALNKDRQHMGNRYVEVMFVNKEQFEAELTRQPGTANSGDYVVRLRGLPYSAQTKDIITFLSDCQIANGDSGVHFTFVADGRPSGEAFVELQSEDDVSKALAHHNEHMGRRYVEMFRASRGQMDWECRLENKSYGEGGEGGGSGLGGGSGGVVRLRGLPYGSSEEDVRRFFTGLNVVLGGIVLQRDPGGGETGEAFVEFETKEDAEKALDRNREKMQHRYIEVFRSSHAEVRPVKATPRGSPYARPGARGGFSGYGGYGAKYGSGYERGYNRGRGRGPPPGHFHPPYDAYGGPGGYYEEPDYYHHGPPDAGGYPPHGPPHAGGPPGGHPGGNGNLVSYPPIRPSSRGGYGGPPGMGTPPRTKHMVRLRGLPYSAKEQDIIEFFQPLVCSRVIMDFDQLGRPSGEAEVFFQSHEDAQAAMKKNNQHIGPRYIELFLHSTEDSGGPMGGAPPPGPAGPMKYPQHQQQPTQQTWGDTRQQPRPMDQGMGGMPPAASAGYPQQRVPASAATQYGGPATGGYVQQQPQQQQYQQQAPGYVGYTDQSAGGYQQSAPAYHDTTGYGQPQQAHVHQQQWGPY